MNKKLKLIEMRHYEPLNIQTIANDNKQRVHNLYPCSVFRFYCCSGFGSKYAMNMESEADRFKNERKRARIKHTSGNVSIPHEMRRISNEKKKRKQLDIHSRWGMEFIENVSICSQHRLIFMYFLCVLDY